MLFHVAVCPQAFLYSLCIQEGFGHVLLQTPSTYLLENVIKASFNQSFNH